MDRERIIAALNTLDGCIGCISEDTAADLIEGLIREAVTAETQRCASEVATYFDPVYGLAPMSVREAIVERLLYDRPPTPEPPTPSPPPSDEV